MPNKLDTCLHRPRPNIKDAAVGERLTIVVSKFDIKSIGRFQTSFILGLYFDVSDQLEKACFEKFSSFK